MFSIANVDIAMENVNIIAIFAAQLGSQERVTTSYVCLKLIHEGIFYLDLKNTASVLMQKRSEKLTVSWPVEN